MVDHNKDIAELHAKLEEVTAERDELQEVFDARWKADQRAIKRWQEATGRTLTWPDHADLCVWLLEQIDKLEVDKKLLREQCRVGNVAFQHLFTETHGQPQPDWVRDGLPNMYTLLDEIRKLESALAKILERAKSNRDLANSDPDQVRWSRIATTAFDALGKPSIAGLAAISRRAEHE
jgi:cell division protein FtsB